MVIVVLISFAVVALIVGVVQWREARLARRLARGGATEVPCWLRGAASPYPAALQRGILSARPGEPVRFVSPSAPAREVVLAAGGLTEVNVRALSQSDGLITGLPVWGRSFAVVECRDGAGVNVQVVVPSAAARPVAEVLAGTASASGPQRAESKRSNSVMRRLVGPWTVAVLTAAVVGAGVHVALWWGSVDVTGEVVAVTPKAGEGATCRVAWQDPWSGADMTSSVNCPATTRVGGSYAGVAKPGVLAPAVTRAIPAMILVLGVVLAVPDWLYRTRLMMRERRVRNGPAYAKA